MFHGFPNSSFSVYRERASARARISFSFECSRHRPSGRNGTLFFHTTHVSHTLSVRNISRLRAQSSRVEKKYGMVRMGITRVARESYFYLYERAHRMYGAQCERLAASESGEER